MSLKKDARLTWVNTGSMTSQLLDLDCSLSLKKYNFALRVTTWRYKTIALHVHVDYWTLYHIHYRLRYYIAK